MNIEQRISNLESRLDSLQESFIQSQRNNVEVTAKADVGYNKPDAPYTETKTAYYGENEKVFYNVPSGKVTVYFDDYIGDYSIHRLGSNLTVLFDVLKADTNITISIMVQ